MPEMNPPSDRFDRAVNSASLEQQTPGLDKNEKARNFAMRGVSWVRERPAAVIGVLGGILVATIGAILAVRARRPPSRLDMLRHRADTAWCWLKEKVA